MKTTQHIFVLALWLTCGSVVHAAGSDDFAGEAKRLGYRESDIALVREAMAAAKASGLPAEPIAAKAFEGIKKRVPAALIAKAVVSQAAALQALRTRAGINLADGRKLKSALAAAGSGVSIDSIRQMAVSSGKNDETFEASLYALGLLRSAGGQDAEMNKFVATQVKARLQAEEIVLVSDAGARALRAGLVSGADLAATTENDLAASNRARFTERLRGSQGTLNTDRSAPAILGEAGMREESAESGKVQERKRSGGTTTPSTLRNSQGTTGGSGGGTTKKPGEDDDHDDSDDDDHSEDYKKDRR